jgi:hypothetical protein
MTEEVPLKGRDVYFLEQFIKHTTESRRREILEQHDLFEGDESVTITDGVPQPKGVKRDGEVRPETRMEQIVLQEAQKKTGMSVLSIETSDSNIPHVIKQVDVVARFDGFKANFHFIAKRDHESGPEIEPVTEEWFRKSVDTMFKHTIEYAEE